MGEGEHSRPPADLDDLPDETTESAAPFKIDDIVIIKRARCQFARFELKMGRGVYVIRRVGRIWRSRESETGWKMIAYRYNRRGKVFDPALDSNWYQLAFNERGDPTF